MDGAAAITARPRLRVSAASRRAFLRWTTVLPLLGACRAPDPPPSERRRRVGVISGLSAEASAPSIAAFRRGLRDHGYAEGDAVEVEVRYLDGRTERAPEVVEELLRLGVAAIVTGNPEGVRAAQQATSSIPIVMAGVGTDPVAQGLVASLARPGGNTTGLSYSLPTAAKILQLLKEIAPQADRLAALWDEGLGPDIRRSFDAMVGEAARTLAVALDVHVLRAPEEIEAAFSAMRAARTGGVLIPAGALAATHSRRIAAAALQRGLPTGGSWQPYASHGGLLSLAIDQADLYRRAAGYLARILDGAPPGELPVEQPTALNLVVNLKTARLLGVAVPRPVLAQATDVIQ